MVSDYLSHSVLYLLCLIFFTNGKKFQKYHVYLQFNMTILQQFQYMAINQQRYTTNLHSKYLNEHILFKKNQTNARLHPFQNTDHKVTPFQIRKQDKDKPTTFISPTESERSGHRVLHNKYHLKNIGNKDNCHHQVFIKDTQIKQKKPPLKRAFSSNRFDLLQNKQAGRKGNKKMFPIFEYAKAVKAQNSSKKSTDESSSEHLQTLKAENEQYRQIIRTQQNKVKLLEQAILQEKKRHELQKQLYSQNIQRLKKIAGLQGQQDDVLSIVEDEEWDRLSIQSN